MDRYYRKPLDVERWGQMEAWEATAAAYIIGGTEPEYQPGATLTIKADEVYHAMKASSVANALRAVHVSPTAGAYFSASEIVQWAKKQGFDLPKGLEAAVQAAEAARMQAAAFSPDLLDIWKNKDLWSEAELLALLCGVKPEALASVHRSHYATEQAARNAIQRAVTAGTLAVIREPVGTAKYEGGKIVPPEFVQYVTPADAIRWAETKRAEFPKFPKFPVPERAEITPPTPAIPKTLTNARSAPPPLREYKFDKPKWDFWSKPGTMVCLWEGICLVVDMEPPRRPDGAEIRNLFDMNAFPQTFREAWNLLNRDDTFSRMEAVGAAGRMLHSINLDRFAYWAIYKGLDVPPELREIAARFKPTHEAIGPGKATEPKEDPVDISPSTQADAPRAEQQKHLSKQRRQELAVLDWLKSNDHDPKRLPKQEQGKPGIKAAVWAEMKTKVELFQSRGVFDKAWERLREFNDIQEGE